MMLLEVMNLIGLGKFADFVIKDILESIQNIHLLFLDLPIAYQQSKILS